MNENEPTQTPPKAVVEAAAEVTAEPVATTVEHAEPTTEGAVSDVEDEKYMAKTPKGFVWRRISPAECEVTSDIFGKTSYKLWTTIRLLIRFTYFRHPVCAFSRADIAGRAYPTLLESPWIRSIQDQTQEGPLSTQRDVIDSRLKSLVGLAPRGTTVTSVREWKGP
jgi:hypothetical protein